MWGSMFLLPIHMTRCFSYLLWSVLAAYDIYSNKVV
jgi:hypothetical protein